MLRRAFLLAVTLIVAAGAAGTPTHAGAVPHTTRHMQQRLARKKVRDILLNERGAITFKNGVGLKVAVLGTHRRAPTENSTVLVEFNATRTDAARNLFDSSMRKWREWFAESSATKSKSQPRTQSAATAELEEMRREEEDAGADVAGQQPNEVQSADAAKQRNHDNGDVVKWNVRQLIPGLRRAIVMMPEGAHWRLFIPAHLAYGAKGRPSHDLAPHETVIYDIWLRHVVTDGGAAPSRPVHEAELDFYRDTHQYYRRLDTELAYDFGSEEPLVVDGKVVEHHTGHALETREDVIESERASREANANARRHATGSVPVSDDVADDDTILVE
jgi:hypothetical protein